MQRFLPTQKQLAQAFAALPEPRPGCSPTYRVAVPQPLTAALLRQPFVPSVCFDHVLDFELRLTILADGMRKYAWMYTGPVVEDKQRAPV